MFMGNESKLAAIYSEKTARMFPPMAKSSKASLGYKFRKQLDSLMAILNKTESHYIRCIKPNAFKAPKEINSRDVLDQLRYSGILLCMLFMKDISSCAQAFLKLSVFESKVFHFDIPILDSLNGTSVCC